MRLFRQRWERSYGAADLDEDGGSPEIVRRDSGSPRREIRPASKGDIERLQLGRRLEKQARGLVAVRRDHREVSSKEPRVRALEAVEGVAFSSVEQTLDGIECSYLKARLRRRERAPPAARAFWRQFGRSTQERGHC